ARRTLSRQRHGPRRPRPPPGPLRPGLHPGRGSLGALHLVVYRGVMSRTNIDIDDELIGRVMRRYRLPSRRAAVELALRRLAAEPMSRDEALAMEGSGWTGDL